MTSTRALDTVPQPASRTTLAPDGSNSTDGLGEAIAELAARLHAATYELLVLLREFDERAGWNCGFLSCAHWLHWRTGIDLGASRQKVRVAKALASLPLVSAAMQRGAISYAKVRALTRVATPENEVVLLDFAVAGTAAHVERFVRAWRRVDRVEDARQTEVRHLHRELSTWTDDDGMVVIRGRLTPDVGAVVQRALEAAADRLCRESAGALRGVALAEDLTPGQRRADALGLLAEAALAADLDRGTAGDRYQVVLHVDASGCASDAPAWGRGQLSEGAPPPAYDGQASHSSGTASRSAADPHDVDEGTDACHFSDTLDVDDRIRPRYFDGTLEVADGAIHVSAETSRRLACDASLVVMGHDGDGNVLDVGRKTRTIPTGIRRALLARDTRCQFPGCTSRRCDAHHVVHWSDGGRTCLENLALLCRRHHRAVHEGGFTLTRHPDGSVIVHRPDGMLLEVAPVLPPWDRETARHAQDEPASASVGPLAPVTSWLTSAGITIDARSVAVWDGTPFDMVRAMDVLRQRRERSVGRTSWYVGRGWTVGTIKGGAFLVSDAGSQLDGPLDLIGSFSTFALRRRHVSSAVRQQLGPLRVRLGAVQAESATGAASCGSRRAWFLEGCCTPSISASSPACCRFRSPATLGSVRRSLREHSGPQVADAYLAALAIEHGCELITTDSDFARFKGLRWRHPLDA